MWAKIPILGWIWGVGAAMSMAVPFWLVWTVFGIGAKYFRFLPWYWASIPFFDCVGIFIILGIVKALLPKLEVKASTSVPSTFKLADVDGKPLTLRLADADGGSLKAPRISSF